MNDILPKLGHKRAHSIQLNTMKTTRLPITPKQLQILLLLYRYRFLNRIQIQQCLHHKNDTRITAWLRDLNQKEYIGRIYSYKIGENIKPAIYYLATKSRSVLKEQEGSTQIGLDHIYRDSARSLTFQSHCLFIGDLYFYFEDMTNMLKLELHFSVKTDLTVYEYFLKPLPDVYIALTAPRKKTKRYFLDVFDEGIPRFALRARIKQYIEYAESGDWEENTNHSFPHILLICPDELTKKFLLRHIPKALEEEDMELVFSVSTRAQISEHKSVFSEMWNAPS